MLFDELTIRQPIEIHGFRLDLLARWWHTKECALVGAPHGEASRHLVGFGKHLLQRPPDVGKAGSHHPNDGEVTRRTPHRFGVPRHVEYCIRRNKLCGQPLAGRVDELRKAMHGELVGFDCHIAYPEAAHSAASVMSLAENADSASLSLNRSTALLLPILMRSASLMLALLNQSAA